MIECLSESPIPTQGILILFFLPTYQMLWATDKGVWEIFCAAFAFCSLKLRLASVIFRLKYEDRPTMHSCAHFKNAVQDSILPSTRRVLGLS